MIRTDEDNLVCDLAETYRVLHYKELTPRLVSVLFFGLRDDSRVKMNLAKQSVDLNTLLLASVLDDLNFLAWSKTEDAVHGQNKPQSIVNALTGRSKPQDEIMKFDSIADFERARAEVLS